MPQDNRPPRLIEADNLLKTLEPDIKDDMLYFIAKEHPDVFDKARFAAL